MFICKTFESFKRFYELKSRDLIHDELDHFKVQILNNFSDFLAEKVRPVSDPDPEPFFRSEFDLTKSFWLRPDPVHNTD